MYFAPEDAEEMWRLALGALCPPGEGQHGEQSAACYSLHQSSSQVSIPAFTKIDLNFL